MQHVYTLTYLPELHFANTICEVEGAVTFVTVALSRTDLRDHHRLAVALQAVLQDVGEG